MYRWAVAGRGRCPRQSPYVMRIRGACGGASPSAASHGLVGEPRGGREARADACVAESRRQRTDVVARASSARAPAPRPAAPGRTRIDTAHQPLHRARLAPRHRHSHAPHAPHTPTTRFLGKHSLSVPLLVLPGFNSLSVKGYDREAVERVD